MLKKTTTSKLQFQQQLRSNTLQLTSYLHVNNASIHRAISFISICMSIMII